MIYACRPENVILESAIRIASSIPLNEAENGRSGLTISMELDLLASRSAARLVVWKLLLLLSVNDIGLGSA